MRKIYQFVKLTAGVAREKYRLKWFPLAMFWLLGIIWGSNFIYMKMATELITPVQVVLLRILFGLIPVAVYAVYQRALKLAHLRHFGHLLAMSLVGTIAYYYGFVKGSSLLLSAVTGGLSGLSPILCLLLALLFLPQEKATIYKLSGIGIGFLGVLLIARPCGGDLAQTNIEGVLYTAVGAFGVGSSFVYAKRYVLPLELPVSALITYQLGLSLVILWLVVDLDGIGNIWSDTHVAAGMVLGLGVLGTGVAYLLYYYILEQLGAVTASSVSYIPPVVAIAIGAIIVGEQISRLEYLGTTLIFAGLVLVNHSAEAPKRQ